MTPIIKFNATTYLSSVILWVLPVGFGIAQIRDNEASKQNLAAHCAISGGGNAANYQSYASSLAKTLSQLTPEQQEEVLELTNANGGDSNTEAYDDGSAFENGTSGQSDEGAATGDGSTGDETGDGGTGAGSGRGSRNWGAWLSAWWDSLWGASTEPDSFHGGTSFLKMAQSEEPTTAVSFASVVITETIASGDRSKTNAVSQVRLPSGPVILQQEAVQFSKPGKLEFRNGKLEFLTIIREDQ